MFLGALLLAVTIVLNHPLVIFEERASTKPVLPRSCCNVFESEMIVALVLPLESRQRYYLVIHLGLSES
jgi:hypothetical protein